MTQFCRVVKKDRVLLVTINRPDRLNALHPPANLELAEVFDDYAQDDDYGWPSSRGKEGHSVQVMIYGGRLRGM
jgi:1,4-dihydroxy-2-naphthoyl-CoA synthase